MNSKEAEEFLLGLSGSEMTSFLLKVFAKRAEGVTPARLLKEWKTNKYFSLPNDHADNIKNVESEFASLSGNYDFEKVHLPPVSPFGTVSGLGFVSQNNVLTALRGCEVISDPTNVLALEAAKRRKIDSKKPIKLSTVHRTLRTQNYSGEGALAHFNLFCMVTAGRDTGNSEFELNLAEHISIYVRALESFSNKAKFKITVFSKNNVLAQNILDAVEKNASESVIEAERPSGNGYYGNVSFKIDWITSEGPLNLVDGGMTDWTAKLLENKKERLIISGTGLGRLVNL